MTKRGAPPSGPAFPIVGIGASAGGLEAYTELLRQLPKDTGMAFVLVQHLDPQHESALPHLLARATGMPVREAAHRLRVQPNHVYVIPPNKTLCIAGGVLKLQPRQESRTPHRSIDFFFESLSQDLGERAIGVVLSGTATDGTLGLEAIKAEGGITFAQDDSAKYDSMPRSAVAAGCVDFVLSPQGIAQEIARIARHPGVVRLAAPATPETRHPAATAKADEETPPPPDSEAGREEGPEGHGYRTILMLLHSHSGVDFSLYKSSTIQRRITRRMVLNKQHTLEKYAGFLRGNAKELDALYSDALISVTSFFRNPEAFDALKRKVFPRLLQQHSDAPLRAWVLGCSTGQEAYSVAMCFTEVADKAARAHRLQIFATDLNEALLEKARHGLYAKSMVQDVAPERLRRFFLEEQGGYRVIKPLRDMVVFARQNLISDPPFSRMDLISCRNLLIYFEPSLQKKVIPTFHYALKPGGFLFLGSSESVGGFTELFHPADKKHKIFSRKAAPAMAFQPPVMKYRDQPPGATRQPGPARGKITAPVAPTDGFRGELSAQREADRVTVNRYAPAGVLVNAGLQVLQFRGATGAYLEPPTGKATFDLLKMAREGLMLPLRAAINQARKLNRASRRENVRVLQDGKARLVNVEVIPLKNLRERSFLVLFEETRKSGRSLAPPAEPPGHAARATTAAGKKQESRRSAELETELTETRDYLQAIQEQHEAANEELQASNEEIQSANEELQSVNEELETSKEELESANEELTTVNDEMTNRNVELNRLNSDLTNFQASAQLAVILLGRDLTIRRFSTQAEKQFNLLASDLGRPIGNIRHKLVLPDLEGLIGEVIASVHETEREVKDVAGNWYSLRVRPYLTLENKVDGAVLVLVDINAQKRSEQAVEATRDYAEAIVRTARDPLLILDADLRVQSANEAFYTTFQVAPEDAIGRLIYDLGNRQWNIPRLRDLLEEILPRENVFNNFAVSHVFEDIGQRNMLLNARRLSDASGRPERILLGIEDVTERTRAQEFLSEEAIRKDEFLAMLAHELRGPLAPMSNALEIVQRADGDRKIVLPALDIAGRQLGHMVRLVDDLLDLSRISQGRLTLRRQRVELASVVHQAVETCRPPMEAAGHQLTVTLPHDPVYLSADPVRLAQIFWNLLSNACKYTEPGGRIVLSALTQGDEVLVSVKDNGIGIAAEMLPKIFGMFVQVDQGMERKQGGLGIGLSLVQRLVELHGGTIEARSDGVGKGSEFVVRLPLTKEVPDVEFERRNARLAQEASATRDKERSASRSILVVDDNHDSAETLALLLQISGHKTQVAYDGLEAVAAAESFHPEVVLLDLGLPKMNGFEAARKIRSEPWGKSILLVALTGWGQTEDRRKSREAGFDAHLVKPVDLAALDKLLAELKAGGPADP